MPPGPGRAGWGIFGRETGTFPRSQLWNAPLASAPDEGYRLLRSKTASHSAGSQRAGSVAVRILDPDVRCDRGLSPGRRTSCRARAGPGSSTPTGWAMDSCSTVSTAHRTSPRDGSLPTGSASSWRAIRPPAVSATGTSSTPDRSTDGVPERTSRCTPGGRASGSPFPPPPKPKPAIAAAVSAGGTGGPRLSTGLVKASPDGMAALRRLLDEAAALFERAGASGIPEQAARQLGEELLRRRRPSLDRESRALPAVTGCEGRPRPRRPAGRGDLRQRRRRGPSTSRRSRRRSESRSGRFATSSRSSTGRAR